MTHESLIEAGYSSFKPNNGANKFFQKRFYNEEGKIKYFLNIYYWDLSKYNEHCKPSYHAEAVMYDGSEETWWEFKLYGITPDIPLHQVERKFEDMWRKMGFYIDRHNN